MPCVQCQGTESSFAAVYGWSLSTVVAKGYGCRTAQGGAIPHATGSPLQGGISDLWRRTKVSRLRGALAERVKQHVPARQTWHAFISQCV
eukprot:5631463-Alexandrium_andersonii.AAC.1